jgi:hypothetical protein
MRPTDAARPPRLATWIVTLFAPPKEAEAIVGDLHEEFTSLVEREGARAARWWYWRHSVRAAGDLALGPFIAHPWSSVAIGVAGLALSAAIGWSFTKVLEAIVLRYPVYAYVNGTIFWRVTGPLPFIVTGWIAATVVRDRPMSAALSIVFALAALLALDTPIMLLLYGPPQRVHITLVSLLVRWLLGVSTFGGLVMLGAVAGRLMGRRDHRRASA